MANPTLPPSNEPPLAPSWSPGARLAADAWPARLWAIRSLWLGLALFSLSLFGTLILSDEATRPWGVLLLVVAGLGAVLLWGHQPWSLAFALRVEAAPRVQWDRRRLLPLAGIGGAALLLALADGLLPAQPGEVFGLSGVLWLASMGLLPAATTFWPRAAHTEVPPLAAVQSSLPIRKVGAASAPASNPQSSVRSPQSSRAWPAWEIALFAGLVALGLALRVWDLAAFPYNIYPDEIMTGQVATGAYISGPAPPVFSTLWGNIDLPALWFVIVAAFLKVGGSTLAVLRLPAALFGAATVVPFYGLVRGVWGRAAALAGTAVFAVSAVHVHYSRLALNNIVTPFFWTVCFFFLLRGLRTRRPLDWALAGLSAGLSEHFYYGTRLLPLLLIVFTGYLLVVHWRQARALLGQLGLLALGYLAGFGPLLVYFLRHPDLYYGRGAGMTKLTDMPLNLAGAQQLWNTLAPLIGENLLGVSTHQSQDIVYFAPLLLPAEAALLVLGVALLVWRWRHPAAFLLLLAGVGVVFVGGTLIRGAPFFAHWTAAFPAFYAAIGIPVGAWIKASQRRSFGLLRWLAPAVAALGIALLGWLNITFYFGQYYADPASLVDDRYRTAQTYYEAQTVQARYQAALGPAVRVVLVGRLIVPFDAGTLGYLVQGQETIIAQNPATDLALPAAPGKGLAFLFYPGNEQYAPLVRSLYPGGSDGSVQTPRGQHMFDIYVVRDQK